jgi:hypothetical protein
MAHSDRIRDDRLHFIKLVLEHLSGIARLIAQSEGRRRLAFVQDRQITLALAREETTAGRRCHRRQNSCVTAIHRVPALDHTHVDTLKIAELDPVSGIERALWQTLRIAASHHDRGTDGTGTCVVSLVVLTAPITGAKGNCVGSQ